MRRRQTAPRGRERERERERKRVWSIHKQVVACLSKRPGTLWLYTSSSSLCLPLPTFLPTSRVSISSSPCSMLLLGFAISHGGAASLGATLRGGAASMGATPRGGAASLGAALRGGVAALDATLRGGAASLGAALSLGRRGTIPSAPHDGGAVPSSCAVPSSGALPSSGVVPLSGVALCKCMMPPSSHDEGGVPSSHDEGAVPSSVSCGSARVLALYACGVEVVVVVGVAVGAVAVVMGAAVGAVAGVAWSVGWGSRGSSCGVESSLAPRAESYRVTSGDPGALCRVIVGDSAAP